MRDGLDRGRLQCPLDGREQLAAACLDDRAGIKLRRTRRPTPARSTLANRFVSALNPIEDQTET